MVPLEGTDKVRGPVAAKEDRGGRLWLSTFEGISVLGDATVVPNQKLDDITDFLHGASGDIWAAQKGALIQLSPRAVERILRQVTLKMMCRLRFFITRMAAFG